MKTLFISDIHGSSGTLQQALQHGRNLGMEQIVLLGDELYHGPRNPLPADYNPQGVIAILNALSGTIKAVRGNCDAEVDQMVLDFPISLTEDTMVFDAVTWGLTHGHVYNEQNLLPGTWDVLALGHSHVGRLDYMSDGRIIFNPGSVALPKGGSLASFGFWEDGILSLRDLNSANILKAITLF